MTYERDDRRRRIIIQLVGAFELAGALAFVDRLAVDEAWSYGLLYDTSKLATAPTMSELQAIVDRVQIMAAQRPRGPVAVVSPDARIYAMVQVYASRLAGIVNIAVFRTIDEGREWLDQAKEHM